MFYHQIGGDDSQPSAGLRGDAPVLPLAGGAIDSGSQSRLSEDSVSSPGDSSLSRPPTHTG